MAVEDADADTAKLAVLFRDAQQVMRALLDIADAAVWAKDLDGRYLFVNQRGAELVGRTPDEFVGRTDAELYDPDQVEHFRAFFDEVVATGAPVMRMGTIHSVHGRVDWLGHVVPLRVGDRLVGVAGMATDVTEQARQDALLRERTRQLETAQRIARLGTWSWDPATGAVELSDELIRLLGGRPGETWTIAALEEITHPDDLAAAIAAVRAARHGAEVDHLFRIRRRDGEQRWLRMRSEAVVPAPLPAAGDAPSDVPASRPRVVGTVQDVTEREEAERHRAELERRLQQGQRLETVGQLAGGVAHDFNNLLAVMEMQAGLVVDDLGELAADDPRAGPLVERLRELQQTIERATTLTRQLLVFSRHEGDDVTVSLSDALARLHPLLDRSLGTAIRLDVDVPDGLPLVRADRAQIEQLVVNLAMNARDAMPDGGVLTITAGERTASDAGDPDVERTVRLVVSDTGSGMSAEVKARAFEPFFTTKPVGVGTGLGLATVHGIVARAGGDVELRSEPGAGTTVEIRLHVVDAEPAPTVAAGDRPSTRMPASGGTVLVVEDLEPLGELAATVLRRAGYRVLLESRPVAAIERADAEPDLDLLLTDVVMPGMSGRQLADRLRERRPDLAVVFMTGYTAGMLGVDADERSEVLAKPFTAGELVAAVRRGLTGDDDG